MEAQTRNPLSIESAKLTELASMGRERALAARRAVAELSPEEAPVVGGGAYTINGPFPWGVLPFLKMADYFKQGFATGGTF